MNLSAFRIAAFAAIAILASILIVWQFGLLSPDGRKLNKIGGPFELIDHNGKIRKSAEFKGKFMLIYFGYSYCPDVCPTALQIMGSALNALGDNSKKIQPIFISIDPMRDNPSHLKTYVKYFHPTFLGLTGSQEILKTIAKTYRVYFAKIFPDKDKKEPENYLMDHSSIIFLMGKNGNYITHFNHQTDPSAIAKVLAKRL